MFVMELTSQLEMSELKLYAPTNMAYMVVTELTSQFEMSELKVNADANISECL
jgi:hypothetical protein